ncbi:MAG TPA: hypothetical protein VMS31_16015, partial [Pyrinomonadaceae bacterium]|nr:hypothetical protein [Pyrinomonadaceae bacterium]
PQTKAPSSRRTPNGLTGMRNPLHTAFAAVFLNDLLLNSRCVAPYALMIFFSSNAVLWSVAGAAVSQGWATNSDFYIRRNFGGFVFGILGLPLFAALITGDPVIRDLRLGVAPLIFSKPVSRASYLLGKFFGSFFVLVCCQAAFALTLIVLQVVHTSRMIVLPFRLFPYFKHFFVMVVVPYFLFSAVYFTVGTLTRNAKIVFGLAFSYYPLYIAWQILVIKNLPPHWQIILDPVLMKPGMDSPWGSDAAVVDRLVASYSPLMIANRGLVVLIGAVCLTVLYLRFSIADREANHGHFSLLDLSTKVDRIQNDPETLGAVTAELSQPSELGRHSGNSGMHLPEVVRTNEGLRANLRKLAAATTLELSLLRGERSLIVIIPLAVLLAFLSLPFSAKVSDVSASASFASHTATGVLLFLLGVIVFFLGESMHRDRELRVDAVVWSVPAPNSVLLLSKVASTLLLALVLVVIVGLTAMLAQLLRGQYPLEISPYLITYAVILVPSLIFAAAASAALNVLLRDKYLAYAVSIATGAGLLYLYSHGYNHWLYNPMLYGLWTPADLESGISRILPLRIYCLTIALVCLLIAHLRFERRA